jgi:hypothetical protein
MRHLPQKKGSAPVRRTLETHTEQADHRSDQGDNTALGEADVRLAAAELFLCHAAVSGDVFTATECVDHALVLIGQARRFLDVAAWERAA